jgi:isoleucyl-tRNA synthetase
VEREGMATQGDRSLLVALDTELTSELVSEGWAREVIHRIQSARKDADLDYSDRIVVRFRSVPEIEAAIDRFRSHITHETLASDLVANPSSSDILVSKPIEGMQFDLAIDRVQS